MGFKTMSLTSLEEDLRGALKECADSGSTVVVKLPDGRLLAILPLGKSADDKSITAVMESVKAANEGEAKSEPDTPKKKNRR